MFKKIVGSPISGAVVSVLSALLGGLSWAGLGFPDAPERRLNWLAVWFVFFFFSALWAFIAQAHKTNTLLERFKPRATIKYDPVDTTVHVQPGNVVVQGEGRIAGPYIEHKYHVGIVNLSNSTLNRMRLVFEEAMPHAQHIMYRGRPMTVRGEAAGSSGFFDLPPNDGVHPSRYVEILHELIPTPPIGNRSVGYRVPYAVLATEEVTKVFFDREKRTLIFRLEGGGLTESLFFRAEVAFDPGLNCYRITQL